MLKIWCICSCFSLFLDNHLKQIHLLGTEIEPCTVVWIKISFLSLSLNHNLDLSLALALTLSLSLSFSLCTFPSIIFFWILLPKVYLLWPWKYYLSQGSSSSLYPTFSHLQLISNLILYKSGDPEVGIETFQIGNPTPTLPIVSSTQWPVENVICTMGYVIAYLIQRSTHFQHIYVFIWWL